MRPGLRLVAGSRRPRSISFHLPRDGLFLVGDVLIGARPGVDGGDHEGSFSIHRSVLLLGRSPAEGLKIATQNRRRDLPLGHTARRPQAAEPGLDVHPRRDSLRFLRGVSNPRSPSVAMALASRKLSSLRSSWRVPIRLQTWWKASRRTACCSSVNALIALARLLQELLEPLGHQRRAAPQREPKRRHGYRRDAECGQDEDDDRGGAKDDTRTGHVHARILLGGKCTSTSSTARAAHQLSCANSECRGFHTMYSSPPLVGRFVSPRQTCASWSTAM